MIVYACPHCGKADSSHDGETFCGPCEEDFRRQQVERGEFRTEAEMEAWLSRDLDPE